MSVTALRTAARDRRGLSTSFGLPQSRLWAPVVEPATYQNPGLFVLPSALDGFLRRAGGALFQVRLLLIEERLLPIAVANSGLVFRAAPICPILSLPYRLGAALGGYNKAVTLLGSLSSEIP